MQKSNLLSLPKLAMAKVTVFVAFGLAVLLAVSSPVSAAFEPTGHPTLDSFVSFLDPQPGELYAYFEVQVNLDTVSKQDAWNLLSDLGNDDLWYSSIADAYTTFPGYGSQHIGQQWIQEYEFAGVLTSDLVTRIWANSPNYQVFYGDGTFADYIGYYQFVSYNGGQGTTFYYRGIYKPSFPVPTELLDGFFAQIPVTYEQDLLPYLGTTGNSTLNQVTYHVF